jgi:hypothetical protein
MAPRVTKGNEDARCGRTLWSFLVACGRRVTFSLFLPRVFNRAPTVKECHMALHGPAGHQRR